MEGKIKCAHSFRKTDRQKLEYIGYFRLVLILVEGKASVKVVENGNKM